jgi:uncharacterized repeat protein (TIGR02543 family)
MSKRNIVVTIALLLLLVFLMAGCDPVPGGGNNGVVPIIVTFDAQGGVVDPETKEVTVGLKYGELPTPSKTDSTFDGWYTEQFGGNKITEDTTVSNTGNHTLYARWLSPLTTKKITVTFDPQGGTVNPKKIEVKVDHTYGKLPIPTKNGYIFLGWYTEKTDGDKIDEDTKVTIDHDHTLYAMWFNKMLFGKTVTVTFDRRDSKTPIPDPINVTVGSAYGTLPKLSGTWLLKFKGWFNKKVGGEKITEDTIVFIDHDHTLYAQWEPHSVSKIVTVTFDAQGGTVNPKTQKVTVGEAYGELPTPIRFYHTFLGWNTTPTGVFGSNITESTKVTEKTNHTLYAQWHYFGPDLSAPTIASYTKGHRWSKETSTTITVPEGTQNGDLLILIFNIFSSKTPNRPAGWNILASVNNKENPGFLHQQVIYYRKLTGPISNFSVSHDYNNSSWILLRIPDGDTPIASPVATEQSWFPDPPALTHNFGKGTDVLWIAVASWSSDVYNSVSKWPTGYNDNHITEIGTHYPNSVICTLSTKVNPQDPDVFAISGMAGYPPLCCACTIAVKRK